MKPILAKRISVFLLIALLLIVFYLLFRTDTNSNITLLATSSTTTAPISGQDYFELSKPILELPDELKEAQQFAGRYGYTSYGDDFGNTYVQVFHSKSPIWSCDLYFVSSNNTITPLSQARAKLANCLDIYTDGYGTWFAVDPGYVGIRGATRVYRLQQDKVFKILGLEELRGLNLYFDTKTNQWFGRWALAGTTKEDVSTQVWHTIDLPKLPSDAPYPTVEDTSTSTEEIPAQMTVQAGRSSIQAQPEPLNKSSDVPVPPPYFTDDDDFVINDITPSNLEIVNLNFSITNFGITGILPIAALIEIEQANPSYLKNDVPPLLSLSIASSAIPNTSYRGSTINLHAITNKEVVSAYCSYESFLKYTDRRLLGEREFSVIGISEGAAGSSYETMLLTSYADNDDVCFIIDITTRSSDVPTSTDSSPIDFNQEDLDEILLPFINSLHFDS